MKKKKEIVRRRTRRIEADRMTRRSEDSNWHQLYKIFIKPLCDLKPAGWNREEWLDYLFSTNSRNIEHMKARATFLIPGTLMITPTSGSIIASDDERRVRRNDVLCIRTDNNDPDLIEIELVINVKEETEKTRLFRLSKKQYEEISHNLMRSH